MSRNDDFNLIDLTENLEKSTEELIREVKTESAEGRIKPDARGYDHTQSKGLNTDMMGQSQRSRLNMDMTGSRQQNFERYERVDREPSERYERADREPSERYERVDREPSERYERADRKPSEHGNRNSSEKHDSMERKTADRKKTDNPPYRKESRQREKQEERRRYPHKNAGDGEMADKKRGKRKSSRAEKKWKRRLIKLALVVVVLFVVVYGAVYAMMGSVDYETMETDYKRPSDVVEVNGVKNILLIGTDARNSDEDGRSDSMIVLSVNTKKNKIVMTSILRDSYVEIPGHGSNRINAAYSYGQEDLLIQTIEQNFKIPIDSYVKVDFFSFIDIVDAVGGVEIDVSEEEKEWVNAYLNETNELLGKEFGDGYLTQAGTQTLTGKQALSYARIRYIGTDFGRTERQREIITAVMNKAKTMGPTAITKILNSVLPEVKTNMKHSELTLLAMKSVLYMGYDMEQIHIPADGTWKNATISGMSVLQLDFDANIQVFKDTVY